MLPVLGRLVSRRDIHRIKDERNERCVAVVDHLTEASSPAVTSSGEVCETTCRRSADGWRSHPSASGVQADPRPGRLAAQWSDQRKFTIHAHRDVPAGRRASMGSMIVTFTHRGGKTWREKIHR